MKVTVLYFAWLREAVGRDREAVELPPEVVTVGALRQWLVDRGSPWTEAFTGIRRIRAAVAQDMAGEETLLTEGAEVAFFPPVTGG
jgi:molybdopterin synthase sulfur carrier subunit